MTCLQKIVLCLLGMISFLLWTVVVLVLVHLFRITPVPGIGQ